VSQQLDPQAAALIEKAIQAGNPEIYELDPAEARKLFLELARGVAVEKVDVARISDYQAPGPNGDIPLRVYWPVNDSKPLPVLVYFHGGGWVIGDLETHDPVCRWLSVRAQCVVVSVDYRMGPEHKFPAAVHDCLAATEWVITRGKLINVDPARIAVGGDSAGGNLAAVVAHELKGGGATPLSYQLLLYPATDLTREEASHTEFSEGYRLTGILMEWFIDHYLSQADERTNPKASPLFFKEFSDLPPALIITAGFDPLRDEGLRYNEKLVSAGVETKYLCYDGMIHGFMSMGGWLDKGKEALDFAGDCLAEAFSKD
jgi:acetyl esterase